MSAAKFNESAGLQLGKVTTLWQRNLAKVLKDFKITRTQFIILAAIDGYQGDTEISQADLVEVTNINKMTVSKSVRSLQTKKLVKVAKSKTDKRASMIDLYAKGKKVTDSAVKAVAKAESNFFDAISDNQVASLQKLSQKIMDSHNK